jgi:hypothetical protein
VLSNKDRGTEDRVHLVEPGEGKIEGGCEQVEKEKVGEFVGKGAQQRIGKIHNYTDEFSVCRSRD